MNWKLRVLSGSLIGLYAGIGSDSTATIVLMVLCLSMSTVILARCTAQVAAAVAANNARWRSATVYNLDVDRI